MSNVYVRSSNALSTNHHTSQQPNFGSSNAPSPYHHTSRQTNFGSSNASSSNHHKSQQPNVVSENISNQEHVRNDASAKIQAMKQIHRDARNLAITQFFDSMPLVNNYQKIKMVLVAVLITLLQSINYKADISKKLLEITHNNNLLEFICANAHKIKAKDFEHKTRHTWFFMVKYLVSKIKDLENLFSLSNNTNNDANINDETSNDKKQDVAEKKEKNIDEETSESKNEIFDEGIYEKKDGINDEGINESKNKDYMGEDDCESDTTIKEKFRIYKMGVNAERDRIKEGGSVKSTELATAILQFISQCFKENSDSYIQLKDQCLILYEMAKKMGHINPGKLKDRILSEKTKYKFSITQSGHSKEMLTKQFLISLNNLVIKLQIERNALEKWKTKQLRNMKRKLKIK